MEAAVLLSALIGEIYDAAIDPAAWSIALARVNAFALGAGAAIYAKDAVNRTGNIYFDDGSIKQRYIDLYFEKYVKLDPSTTQHYFGGIDEPISTVDFIDYAEFVQTRFYKEWAQPQGLVDHVTSVLEKSSTSVALFGVFRNERQGLVDDEMRQRMRLVAPHIRRAVLISRLIDLKQPKPLHGRTRLTAFTPVSCWSMRKDVSSSRTAPVTNCLRPAASFTRVMVAWGLARTRPTGR
jgi:hypothetical protein